MKTRFRSALSAMTIASLVATAAVIATPTAANATTCVKASQVVTSSAATLARVSPCLTGTIGQWMSASKMDALFKAAAASMAASQRTSLSYSARNDHNVAARTNVYRMAVLLVLPYFKTAPFTATEATRLNDLRTGIMNATMTPTEFTQLTNLIRNLHAYQLTKAGNAAWVNFYFTFASVIPTGKALSGANIDAVKAATNLATGLMNREVYLKGVTALISASISKL